MSNSTRFFTTLELYEDKKLTFTNTINTILDTIPDPASSEISVQNVRALTGDLLHIVLLDILGLRNRDITSETQRKLGKLLIFSSALQEAVDYHRLTVDLALDAIEASESSNGEDRDPDDGQDYSSDSSDSDVKLGKRDLGRFTAPILKLERNKNI